MRRKSLFAGLMAVQLLAALATCQLGSSTATHPGPQPTPRYRPVTPEHRGGTLVLADWEAPTTLDPIHATTVSSLRVSSLLFAPLWGLDPDLLPYPDLVREVPSLENHDVRVGADGVSMTVLIKLVPGLRWSDGQPLTVDDVTFTVDAICAGSRDATGFDRIVAQERRSATELLWRFGPRHAGTCNLTSDISSGLYPALDLLGPRARILPRHSLAALPSGDWPTSSFFRHPEASSGPFAFRGSLATDLIDLGANPHYADGRSAAGVYGVAPIRFDHPPSLDGLTFRFYLSRAALLAGLKAGESDVGFHLAAADAEELRGPPTSETIISPSLQGEYLNPNHAVNSQTHRTPPWVGDPAVLDALKLAIDRPALNRAAFGGAAAVAQGLFPGSMRSYALANSIPAGDPAAAARLLDADGWKVGAGGPDSSPAENWNSPS